MDHNKLTYREFNRYHRHLILPGFGIEAQEKLKSAKVLIVGIGGLGSPVATYLTAAGIGTVGIIDNDKVSESNLQRQVLYTHENIGQPKVKVACNRLSMQNPYIKVIGYNSRLNRDNANDIISQYDIVVDGADNFATRYLMDDVCKLLQKPYVYGAVFEYSGQVSVFNYKGGPSYRQLYPDPQEENIDSMREIGVIGVLPGIVGCTQSNEAIKIISGIGDVLSGKLLLIDSLACSFSVINF